MIWQRRNWEWVSSHHLWLCNPRTGLLLRAISSFYTGQVLTENRIFQRIRRKKAIDALRGLSKNIGERTVPPWKWWDDPCSPSRENRKVSWGKRSRMPLNKTVCQTPRLIGLAKSLILNCLDMRRPPRLCRAETMSANRKWSSEGC